MALQDVTDPRKVLLIQKTGNSQFQSSQSEFHGNQSILLDCYFFIFLSGELPKGLQNNDSEPISTILN